jgi:hypothetical protein
MGKSKYQIVLEVVDKFKKNLDKLQRGLKKVQGVTSKLTKVLKMGAFAAAGLATAFGLLIKSNIAAIDKLQKTAEKLGVNVEFLQKMRFAAEQAGIAQTTLDMALQRFIRRVGEAQNGTGEAKAALEELGIQLTDGEGNFRAIEDVLFDVSDGLKAANSSTTQLRLSFKFFDSEGAALVSVLNKGSEELKKFFEDAEKLGVILDAETSLAVGEFADKFTLLKTQVTTFVKYATAAFVPVLDSITQKFIGIFTEASKDGGFKQLGIDIAFYTVSALQSMTLALAEFINRLNQLRNFDAFGAFTEALIDTEAVGTAFDDIMLKILSMENGPNPFKKLTEGAQEFTNILKFSQAQFAKFTQKIATDVTGGFQEFFDFTKQGFLDFGALAKRVLASVINELIKAFILKKLFSGASKFFGADSLIGSVFSKAEAGLGYEGGGFTGSGSRSGGIDGRGGFPAILHPNESVIDHTQGGGMGATVNFNINTVDAAGFDQLLVQRKNTITMIINNAMNSQGKMGIV